MCFKLVKCFLNILITKGDRQLRPSPFKTNINYNENIKPAERPKPDFTYFASAYNFILSESEYVAPPPIFKPIPEP